MTLDDLGRVPPGQQGIDVVPTRGQALARIDRARICSSPTSRSRTRTRSSSVAIRPKVTINNSPRVA